MPLLIALHGSGGTPGGFESYTGFDRLADKLGFVAVYLDSPQPLWKDPSNIGYIGSIISQLEASDNIDPRRVYVVGFSLGGYAAFRSGCELSSRVAAIAVVSQAMAPESRKPCRISRPVSELTIAGSNDLFPIHQTSGSYISADQTAAAWRSLNGCSSQSQTSQVGPTSQTTWSQCDDGSSVAQYVVNGGVHVWPGSPGVPGADAQYDATQAIWDFLSRHQGGSSTTAEATVVSIAVNGRAPRRLRAVVRVGESAVRVHATLTVRGHLVASKTLRVVRGPRRSFVLSVPRGTRAGRGTLKLAFTDSYGRRLTVTRGVRIPSLPT
jgi:polyhydroxybutyrate depolymerase